jgi:Protein of unknown function (DUF1579)
MKPIVMLLAAAVVCASLAFAQAQPGSAAQPGTTQQPSTPTINPPAGQAKPGMPPGPAAFGPEMEKLAFLVGNWSTAEQHEAAPGMPAGSSNGRAFFRPGPGSRSLVEQYLAAGSGLGDFQGLGIISWDPKKQAYNAYWCDSMTPSGCEPMGIGAWKGKELVFTGETEQGGQKVQAREVYTDITPDSFTFQMFMGEGPKPAMTIKYTKSGPLPRGLGRPGPKPAPGAAPTPAPTPNPSTPTPK